MSFFDRLHLRKRRAEPSKIWLMSETAPFQVPLMVYFLISGLVNLASNLGITPRSVDQTYDTWLIVTWASATVVGAALSLLGRYIEAYRMESAGLAFLLVACGIFTCAVLWVNGFSAAFSALGFVAIGAGCAIRMRVIARHHKAQKVAGEIIQQNGDNPS